MELAMIIAGTLAAGAVSVSAAALMAFAALDRWRPRLIGFAIGVLLAVAFVDLIPQVVMSGPDPDVMGWWLLGGVLAFFFLEKHARGTSPNPSGDLRPVATMILLGDGLHNFVDGILIAAAFLQSPATGVATTVAIVAHEIPQELGDFALLLSAGLTRRRALLLNLASSCAAIVGGVIGYLVLGAAEAMVPYVLILAAASFIYIAIGSLVPHVHCHHREEPVLLQFTLVAMGIAVVAMGHGHAH